jgi:hypothetical protein
LELLPEVSLDKVLVQPLLMHQGLFVDVDENNQPTGKPLRTYIDAAARLDLQGNRDLLRRAKCLQPGGEGGMNDAQSVRSFTGDVCVARYGYVCTTHARLPPGEVCRAGGHAHTPSQRPHACIRGARHQLPPGSSTYFHIRRRSPLPHVALSTNLGHGERRGGGGSFCPSAEDAPERRRR